MEYVFLEVVLVAGHQLNIKVYCPQTIVSTAFHMFVYIGIHMPFEFICVPHVHYCVRKCIRQSARDCLHQDTNYACMCCTHEKHVLYVYECICLGHSFFPRTPRDSITISRRIDVNVVHFSHSHTHTQQI